MRSKTRNQEQMLYDKPEPSSPRPLDYAGPSLADDIDPYFPLHVGRRVVFTIGMTLVGYGLGCGLPRYDDATYLGWGGLLLGLTLPIGRWRRR